VVVVAGPVGLREGHGDAGAFVTSSFSAQFGSGGGMRTLVEDFESLNRHEDVRPSQFVAGLTDLGRRLLERELLSLEHPKLRRALDRFKERAA
jgi:hypothetical protein